MRIFYKPLYFRALLLSLLVLGASIGNVSKVYGQIVTLGSPTAPNNTAGFPNPFPDGNDASRQQYLYLASELRAGGMMAGKITEIRFYKQIIFAAMTLDAYEISMGLTNQTTLNNSSWVPTTTVVLPSSSYAVPTPTGWMTLALTTPFDWDGVQNVVVDICVGQPATSRTANPTINYMTTSFNSSHSSAQNGVSTGCGSSSLTTTGTQTWRPSTQFKYVPNCIAPDSIEIYNITASSADVRWPASISGTPYVRAYNWIYWPKSSPMPATFNSQLATSQKLGQLVPEECYYVRVQTDCKFTGAATDTSVFILDSFCTIPDCIPPTPTVDRITSTTAVASWPPVPTAYDYEYAVSVLNVPPTSGIRTTSTAVPLMGLTSGQIYNFFVRAYCAPTPMSRWSRFEFRALAGLGFDGLDNTGFGISTYPNPVKDVITIQLTSPSDNGSIEIIDLTGKVVRTNSVNGTTVDINMSGLTSGMYLVKYTDRLHSKMIKITKE